MVSNMKAEYMSHMGDDLSVANIARVSFAKENKKFTTRGDKAIGSDEGLIEYLATHNHWCYDDKTEVFTNRGWVNFGELTYTDKVAQVSGWEAEDFRFDFVLPEKIHRTHYEGTMYEGYGEKLSYCVTPHHKMLYMGRDRAGLKGYWEIGNSDVLFGKDKRFRVTAKLSGDIVQKDLDEGRLLGFLLGDGCSKNSVSCSVRLKRERKIVYLESLLLRLGTHYTKSQTKDGVTEFYIKSAFNLYKNGEKHLDIKAALDSGVSYCQGVFEGLLNSDGSKKRNTHTFSSSSKSLMESFIVLGTVCGKNVVQNKPLHGTGNSKLNYRAMVQTRDTTTVSKAKGKNKEREIYYKGYVSCVTVPTGMLLVRRDGKQLVCGNTPFGHAQITLRMSAPVPIRTQCFKHKAGFVENEESRRYITSVPEIYIPSSFRNAPEGNKKQGSSGDHPLSDLFLAKYTKSVQDAVDLYLEMVNAGICTEQARFVLPQGAIVNWIWTGSLAAYARFYGLRVDSHAQKEVQQLARDVGCIIEPLFPYCWKYLTAK